MTYIADIQDEIWDNLHEAGVFRSGFNPEFTANADAYMTIVDFTILGNYRESLFSTVSKEDFIEACREWFTNPNTGICIRLAAGALLRDIGETKLAESLSATRKKLADEGWIGWSY